jgi:broad specificity phosphatase PhoE
MNPDDLRIDLLRHGEPEGGKKYRGQTDDPLTERGWQQMRAAVGPVRPWTRIVTSPLQRCGAFAEALAAETGAVLQTDARLMEVDYGRWAGRTLAEIRQAEPEVLRAFQDDPWRNRPTGAETMPDFTRRVLAAYDELRATADGPQLIVGHAGVLRTIIAHSLGMPLENLFQLQLPYAGRARFEFPFGPARLTHMAPTPPEG